MAQTGYTPILVYASGTATNVPLAANLTSSASGAELALNYADGKLYYKNSSGVVTLLASSAGASGDVVGPASATDNALARFDTTTGKLIQNSVGILSDAGALSGLTDITASGNVTLSGGTANGVAYLNGSKVLTTGSALTYDGNTFKNDTASTTAANIRIENGSFNRVGTFALTANGVQFDAFDQSSTSTQRSFMWLSGGSEQMRLTSTGLGIGNVPAANTRITVRTAAQTDAAFAADNGVNTGFKVQFAANLTSIGNDFNNPLAFLQNNTEQMRLTSTGLGIGTSSPATKLHVSAAGSSIITAQSTNNGSGAFLRVSGLKSSGTALIFEQGTNISVDGYEIYDRQNSQNVDVYLPGASSYRAFYTNGTEKMRLDASGNLGIGTSSPAATAGVTLSKTSNVAFEALMPAVASIAFGYNNSGSTNAWGAATSTAFFGTPQSVPITFTTGAVERMRLDASGNLGLGVTPSVWNSAFKTLEMSNGSLAATSNGPYLSYNAYYSASGWLYKSTAAASQYLQTGGAHQWYTAPSGTAGNAITFTQAMTLDASGNLGVGATSPNAKIQASGSGSVTVRATTSDGGGNNLDFTVSGTAGEIGSPNGIPLVFKNANTERARIDTSGNLLVGTPNTFATAGVGVAIQPTGYGVRVVSADTTNATETFTMYSTGATAYRFYVDWSGKINAVNTTIAAISDQRLKENIQDLDVGLNAVMALKPRKFDWKAGKGKDIKNDRGWIAQEFEQVFPDMVDTWKDEAPEGEEPYKSVRADLIPVLVKAIQELNAKVQTLEAQLKGA